MLLRKILSEILAGSFQPINFRWERVEVILNAFQLFIYIFFNLKPIFSLEVHLRPHSLELLKQSIEFLFMSGYFFIELFVPFTDNLIELGIAFFFRPILWSFGLDCLYVLHHSIVDLYLTVFERLLEKLFINCFGELSSQHVDVDLQKFPLFFERFLAQ